MGGTSEVGLWRGDAPSFRSSCVLKHLELDFYLDGPRRRSMETSLLAAGIACLAAAIVGGGLKAFGVELPVLKSGLRQAMLGVLGIALIVAPRLIATQQPTIGGTVFDERTNAPISGVHLGLSTSFSGNGQVVADYLDTTGTDGKFSFACPKGIDRTRYPLYLTLSHNDWSASMTTRERVEAGIPRTHVNIPVQVAQLLATPQAGSSTHVGKPTSPGGAHATALGANTDHAFQSQPLTPNHYLADGSPRSLLVNAGIAVKVRDAGEAIEFQLTTVSTEYPMIQVDVDQSGDMNPGDTSYALLQNDSPCTQYLLGASSSTVCGMFKSEATLKVQRDGALKTTTWMIPKSELSPGNNSVRFLIARYGGEPPRLFKYPSDSFGNPFVLEFARR